jgi:hypothetical protein
MITNPTITVDGVNHLPHGTVRRAPDGFAHAILLDQNGQDAKWLIIDLYGPMETEADVDVVSWPVVYVPAPDEIWMQVTFSHLRDPEDCPPDQHGALLAVDDIDEPPPQ